MFSPPRRSQNREVSMHAILYPKRWWDESDTARGSQGVLCTVGFDKCLKKLDNGLFPSFSVLNFDPVEGAQQQGTPPVLCKGEL